jgi:hypothetical protein
VGRGGARRFRNPAQILLRHRREHAHRRPPSIPVIASAANQSPAGCAPLDEDCFVAFGCAQ